MAQFLANIAIIVCQKDATSKPYKEFFDMETYTHEMLVDICYRLEYKHGKCAWIMYERCD